MGIIPYIIAEALCEKSANEQKRARASVRHLEEQDAVDSQVRTERLLEQMKELPVEEQERLRNEAIKSLIGQGYQRQFVRDILIKIEMLRLLKQE